MKKRLCLFPGSFNPPGKHHAHIAAKLAEQFDEVRILTCGYRTDKPTNNALTPVLRAAIIDLGFQGIPRVSIDHFDLENAVFTSAADLESRFAGPDDEIWLAVTSDLVRGGAEGKSEIQTTWVNGSQVWQELKFAVYDSPQNPLLKEDLPPHACHIKTDLSGSSLEIRRRLYEDTPCDGLLTQRVMNYIQRYGLFRLSAPQHEGLICTHPAKLLLVADERNAHARAFKEKLDGNCSHEDPDLILVIGGDGTMLSAIHDYWKLRRPFVGLNAGHLGFLMNEPDALLDQTMRLSRELIVRRLPMLHIEFEKQDGSTSEALSFNDAWVERASPQTAWLRISVNDQVKLEKTVCDGVLVSTAAGSTAYAMSMGASPLLVDTPAWMVVGSNVMRPVGWKSALLPFDATVRVDGLNTDKRPLTGNVFGQMIHEVISMTARISRVATVELAFSPAHDMARKISDLQFGFAKHF